MITENLQQVTKHNPCPHCGKPDWCYFLGNLSVCKRDAEPAPSWKMTSKQDSEGSYYYAPEDKPQKAIRPAQKRTWEYPDRQGKPLVRVVRIDDGKGSKPKRWQERWNGREWVKGLKGIERVDIPIYRYREIREAIAQGKTIFIVEGETCYTPDTEVLTPEGWVKLENYKEQSVLQYNSDGTSSFVNPSRVIKNSYSGEIIHTYVKGLSIMTTPDHDMVALDYKGRLFKHKAEQRPAFCSFLPRTTKHSGNGINLADSEIQLAIAISADGHFVRRKKSSKWSEEEHYHVTIEIKKDRKKQRLKQILESSGIDYDEQYRQKENFTAIVFSLPLDFPCFREFPWDWLEQTTLQQKELILSELVHWDGNSVPNRQQHEYSSKHHSNAVWVQTLAHLTGRISTLMHRQNQLGSWYKVSILHTKKTNSWQAIQQTKLPYEGLVYCLTVSSGMLLIRKDNTISICGNCADALWNLDLPATTNIGGSGKWQASDTQDLKEAKKIVLCPDRDEPGIKHMETIATDFKDAQWLYAFPNSPFWHNLPSSGGIDVADWIEDYNLTKAQVWEAIEPYREELPNPEVPTTPPPSAKKYPQMCIDTIFSDTHWISFNGKLYQWVGTHYQKACRVKARKRIVNWCDTTPVETKTGWKYAYADATHVENIWKWVLEYFEVAPEQINPPGINCLNGVVKINWNNGVASWELVPHDPEVIYTYVSEFNFDPDADSTQCDRMLSCLEPEQQQLFIQTMAASLDLATIRKYRGRTVKALLCKGDGNNGKDTLREAVRLLFGEIGMSDATIGDFKAYDNGRKFDLAKLEGTRINWSSENSSYDELDRIESLKKAITGESLDMERKGVDSHTMNLSTVFLFNVNETPNLKAGLEAIQSRWAVLNFDKTYKVNADPSKGELEADSRFRYDPYFIKEQVCPALLNKMLKALKNLAVNGLDYSCTEQALQDIQKETNHLWAFAQDMGLEYQTGSKIYINDLWESLREWYINNGTLEIVATDKGKEKKIWHDQPRRGDRNVKAPNQIYQRFAELFPKIKKQREKKDSQRKGQFYLTDISFSEANRIASEATVKQSVKHQTQSQSENEANEVKNSITQAKKIIGELNKSEQKALISWLTAIEKSESNCSTANKNLSANKNSAKGEKIASPASPLDTVSVTASPTASLTASPDEITASLITKKHFASLSSTVDREGVTTSTNGSRSESLTFEIGSSVANNNPEKNSYNWHGTIVGFDGDGADVRWDERKGMKGGQVLWHNLSELRLL